MNIWANSVITKKGLALQSKLITGTTLNITKVVVGAGYVNPVLLQDQTAVSQPKQTITMMTGIAFPEEGKCAVTIKLTNDDLTVGYTAMQIGFYATDPDVGEILYFISQAESGTGTVIPADSEMTDYSAEFTYYFQYGQADNVTVVVDPAGTVTESAMQVYVENFFNTNLIAITDDEIDEAFEEGTD